MVVPPNDNVIYLPLISRADNFVCSDGGLSAVGYNERSINLSHQGFGQTDRSMLTFVVNRIFQLIIFIPPIVVILFFGTLFFRFVRRVNDSLLYSIRIPGVKLLPATLLFSTLLWDSYIFSGGYIVGFFLLNGKYLNAHFWCSPYSASPCPDQSYGEWIDAKIQSYGMDWGLGEIEIVARTLPWTQPEGTCYTRSIRACQLVDGADSQPTSIKNITWGNATVSMGISFIIGYVIMKSLLQTLQRKNIQAASSV